MIKMYVVLQHHSQEVLNWIPTIEEFVHCANVPLGDNPTIFHLKL